MNITSHRRRFVSARIVLILFVSFGTYLCTSPASSCAQTEAAQEVAVNLVEGRVIICAAKDGIIVATVDAHGEAGSHPPAVTMLSAIRAGVMLGAVEWIQPESKDKPVRLDNEFRGIVASALNTPNQQNYAAAATDIETIGVAVLERIRQLAELLHNKINIAEDEPLIRIVLVGYVPDYGPEAWTIDYHIRQDALGNDYWRTRVLRPTYNQLYPPEKGKPHTLAEVRYPPANRAKDAPELLDLLRQNDPRLTKIRSANEVTTKSITFVVDGQSQKSAAASDIEFLKAALPATAPQESKYTMALVDFDRGFHWVIEPPKPEPDATAPNAPAPNDTTPQEPERPTLRRKSDK